MCITEPLLLDIYSLSMDLASYLLDPSVPSCSPLNACLMREKFRALTTLINVYHVHDLKAVPNGSSHAILPL